MQQHLNGLQVHGKHQFDLTFIDADKANYQTYYELCLQLIWPGGVILIDNTLWGGRVTLAEIEDAKTQVRLATSLFDLLDLSTATLLPSLQHDKFLAFLESRSLVLQAIRQLNSNLLKDSRVFVSVLANADGLSIVVKKR